MEHAALIVMGPLGLPFLIYGIINYVIYFRFGGSSEVLIPVFIASFAAISADSLPSIPTWAGIHSMEMLNLTVEARFSKDNILSTLSGLDLDFPFCSACIALRESVKITEFWMPPLRIHACSIAISSVVKTDRIGFSLILDVWLSSGTTKASPTVLAVGSLLPSV